MTSYLVIKRTKAERDYFPGEVMIDPERPDLLVQRGFVQEVSDDFEEKRNTAAEKRAARRPTVEEAIQAGYSEEAAKSLAAGRMTKKVEAETEKIGQRLSRQDSRPEDERIKIAAILEVSDNDVLDLSDEDYEAVKKENLIGEQPVVPPGADEPSKGTDAEPDKENSTEAVVDREAEDAAEPKKVDTES